MATTVRSRLHTDQRRAQLLELGLQLFGTRAYDEIAIDDIAAAAGVSKGLLYHYFGGKRAFYVATVEHAAARLVDALQTDPTLPRPQRARAGLQAYLDFVEQRAEAYAALVTGGLGADPEVAGIVEATRTAIVGRMLVDLGLSTPRPTFRVALRSFIGAVEAASIEWLRHRDLPRTTLLTFLVASLRNTVREAAELDPDAGVDADAIA